MSKSKPDTYFMNRTPLLTKMQELSDCAIDCRACRGECCTSKTNSMQITELEGRDILADLESRGRLNLQLLQRIDETIADYRLDVEIPSFGSRANLRRSYTCPLYNEGRCTVSAAKKPFGCLAFNPIAKEATGLSSGCRSDQAMLAECAPEGSKAPIPVMLKRLIQSGQVHA